MKTDNERLRDMLEASRRTRKRERRVATMCNAVLAVNVVALVWAVCALIGVKRDEAKESRLLEEQRAVTSYLAGGAA